jgi:hypothetical protein
MISGDELALSTLIETELRAGNLLKKDIGLHLKFGAWPMF